MTILNVPQSIIEENVHNALKEDIGEADITAELIPAENISIATVITREPCVFCGMDWFDATYRQLDKNILIDWHVEDGDHIDSNQSICSISGPSRPILSGERTAINYIQTLSATATRSAEYAAAVAGSEATVLDTRKTIPGLRMAQKYAVSCGGCENHRIGLYDAFLIKENHIHACGNIQTAVEEARFYNPQLPVEVEVENLQELAEAIAARADRVLLDNFELDTLRQAVTLCKGKIITEASGNVTLDSIRQIADTGVQYISTGSMTKDIKAIDFSMRFD